MKILSSVERIINFNSRDSDRIVRDFIQKCEDRGESGQWKTCFSGFDNDPRELIEIPAASKFARRLIDLGLLSGS